MIKIIRRKFGMKILELRYPNKLIEEKGHDAILIRSFKNLNCSKDWNKTEHITMTIDLTKPLNKIFQRMNKNYQKHIRREEREKIEVSIGEEKDLKEFYNKLFIKLYKKKNLKIWPYNYLKKGTLWVAKKDNKILSGSIVFSDKDYATQVFTVSEHIEYNGNRFLIWKAVQYYKNKGLKEFNFGGGFSDYKKRFGSYEKPVWNYMKYVSRKSKILNKIRNFFK